MKTIFTSLLFCLALNTGFSQSRSLPYYTGFDSSPEKSGWTEYRTGDLGSSHWNNNGGLSHDYNVGANSTDTVIDWYVSPPLNFTSHGVITMKVATSGFSSPTPDNCEIWFGTKNPNPSTGNFVVIGNLSYIPKFQWKDTAIVVPFTTDSGYIAFKYKTVGAAWMTYTIDSITAGIAVGINDKDNFKKTDLIVYPNPFKSEAMVQFDPSITNAELNIYNVCGQKVQTINPGTENKIKIERSGLPGGVYFIQLVRNYNIIATKKLVISD